MLIKKKMQVEFFQEQDSKKCKKKLMNSWLVYLLRK